MKKFIEAVKANKTLLAILAVIIALIAAVIIFYNGDEAEGVSSEGKSGTEIKLESILSSIEGVGESRVLVTEGEEGIEGVVIVCSGAENIMTRNDILNAVSTALNINKNIIAIYAMDK